MLSLELENNPLEILNTSFLFQTSSSPGRVNFSSLLGLIRDVNKRVLLVRNKAGEMVARCLLGLVEDGGVVKSCIHHLPGYGDLKQAVQTFVDDLCKQMKTINLSGGKLTTLVAESWLDDSPVDVFGQYPFLEPGSDFRNSLLLLDGSALFPWLMDLFGDSFLDELALPLVFSLPEFAANPKLIRVTIPQLCQFALFLQANTLLDLAGQIAHMGEAHAARVLLTALHRKSQPCDASRELLDLLDN